MLFVNNNHSIAEGALQQDPARYYYLKGRALNVIPEYNKEAEDLLSKAIKLDPKLVDAWNELGECYWKNNKLKEATNCFTGALKHVINICLQFHIRKHWLLFL